MPNLTEVTPAIDVTEIQMEVIPAVIKIDGLEASKIAKGAKEFVLAQRNSFGEINRSNYKEAKAFKNKLSKSFSYIETLRKDVKKEIMIPYEVAKKDFDLISKIFDDERKVYVEALSIIDKEDKDLIAKLIHDTIAERLSDLDPVYMLELSPKLTRYLSLLGSITMKGELTRDVLESIDEHVDACKAFRTECLSRVVILKDKGLSVVDISNYKELTRDEFMREADIKVQRKLEIIEQSKNDDKNAIIAQYQATVNIELTKIASIINYSEANNDHKNGIEKLSNFIIPACTNNDASILSALEEGRAKLQRHEAPFVAANGDLNRFKISFEVEFDFKPNGTQAQIEQYLNKMYAKSIEALKADTEVLKEKRKNFFVGNVNTKVSQ